MMRVGGDLLERFPDKAKGALGDLGVSSTGHGEGDYLAAHLGARRRPNQNEDDEAAIAR